MNFLSGQLGVALSGAVLLAGVVMFARGWAIRRRLADLEALAAERERAAAETAAELRSAEARLEKALADLRRAVRIDPLTGLWNRRQIDDVAPREIERSRRGGDPISAILFDLDYFKTVNDLHGHATGDAVLVEVARRVTEAVRSSDWLIRWGGEEFLVVAPSTSLDEGAELAERLRKAIGTAPVEGGGVVTASFGVARLEPGEKFESWIARADRALAMAKATGRNNVRTDRGPAHPVQKSGPVVRLIWDSAFLSGNDVIDAGHQRLFALGNEALETLTSGADREKLLEIADQYCKEISRHHVEEEEQLASRGWANLDGHRRVHQALLEETNSLAMDMNTGSISPGRFFAFLVHEVVLHHMLVQDKEFLGAFRQGT